MSNPLTGQMNFGSFKSTTDSAASSLRVSRIEEEACAVFSLAFHAIGDYSRPNDGFCFRCLQQNGGGVFFQNSGDAIRYVREAVVARLKADGYAIPEGFDPETGEEIE